MKLTKHGHACVRLERDGRALVIDPGEFSVGPVLDGVEAVLITHRHTDHVDVERLAAYGPPLEVWTSAGVAELLAGIPAAVHIVGDGDRFEAAGLSVRVFGDWHAPSHPDTEITTNIGFLAGEEVFYPGDALTVPGVPVPTLLLPTQASWMLGRDWVEYLREIRPLRAYSTHDGMFNDDGLALIEGWLEHEAERAGAGADYRRLAVGESVALG